MKPPTGIVTFLFTDIEGSTKLSQEFPETLQSALDRHHSIMKSTIKSNNGFVFEIVGDAFCCAFEKSEDAVKAAVDVQINLRNEKWNDAVIKIRIGIHSGKAEWGGERYMGYITLARAARVMSAAYGEQIIISNDAYDLAIRNIRTLNNEISGENTGGVISFRDLGERRLKDVIQPIRLYQIVANGLREDFPPLKTLDARPNNLPIQLTSFIGREKEIRTIVNLLKQTHLLTLTGSGGAGKTRLALQAGADMIDEFNNGVWIVELANLSDPGLLTSAVIKTFGVMENPEQSAEDTLIDYIKNKEMLLIMDNCEHMINEVSAFAEKLLVKSPGLKILATSREALRCEGERSHRILPLNFPDPVKSEPPEQLTQYESVRLFIERAIAVNSNFIVSNENAPALAQICFQLDGIPLAIELAAARMKVLSVEQIHQRLDKRFHLLTGGRRTSLPRQQTLKAMIDWSYDLLSENEKIFWRRLSSFSGGWTLEAAEEICSFETIDKYENLDLLNNLTEKSIIIFDDVSNRYRMLETIRQYGFEKLRDSGELDNISRKHFEYFSGLAEMLNKSLYESDTAAILEIFDSDRGNFEKGLMWALGKAEYESGAKLACTLTEYWEIRGLTSEGLEWLQKLYSKKPDDLNLTFYKVIYKLGHFAKLKNDLGKASEFFEISLEYFKKNNHRKFIADNLNNLATVFATQGNSKRASEFLKESLTIYRELKDQRGIGMSLYNLGLMAFNQREFENSKGLFEECIAIYTETKDNRGLADTLLCLGRLSHFKGEYEDAYELIKKAQTFFKELGYKRGISHSLFQLGELTNDQGKYEESFDFMEESLSIFREIADKRGIAYSLANLGVLSSKKDEDINRAIALCKESLSIFRETGDKGAISWILVILGELIAKQGMCNEALELFNEALELSKEIGDVEEMAESSYNLGKTYFSLGDIDKARMYHKESLEASNKISSYKLTVLNLLGFSEIYYQNGFDKEAAKLLGAISNYNKINNLLFHKSEQSVYDKLILNLRSKMNADEFSKVFEEGVTNCQLSIDNILNTPS